jgi:hypothetical protein
MLSRPDDFEKVKHPYWGCNHVTVSRWS